MKYLVHCNACSYHLITKGDVNLQRIPLAPIQKNLPTLNTSAEFLNRNFLFKCPKCGRGIKVVKYEPPKKKENDDQIQF